MDLSHPLGVVTTSVDGDVLRVLALADAEFTASQVHELVGEHSLAGVRNSLERLSVQGIVLRRGAGKAYLYQLNREHLAASSIGELARLRERFIERLVVELKTWQVAPLYSSLFGSAARGEMSTESDIDILVIRPAHVVSDNEYWSSQLYVLSRKIKAWTGNGADVLEYGEEELRGSVKRDPVIVRALQEGIVLWGDSSSWKTKKKLVKT